MAASTIIWLAAIGACALAIVLYPINVLIANRERERRRQLLRDIISEKLEVIRTAITMGYQEDEIEKLDARLEKILGGEQLQELISQVDLGSNLEEPEEPARETEAQ